MTLTRGHVVLAVGFAWSFTRGFFYLAFRDFPLCGKCCRRLCLRRSDVSGGQATNLPLAIFRFAENAVGVCVCAGPTYRKRKPQTCLSRFSALRKTLSAFVFGLRQATNLVGVLGFEPRTLALSRRCSNQLSYTPLVYELTFINPNSLDHPTCSEDEWA